MKREWWMRFFGPDGGAAGGGTPDGGAPEGAGEKPTGGEPGGGGAAPEGDKKDDLAGLKSALAAERKQRGELQKSVAELTAKAAKGEEVTKELEAVNKKLSAYELRDTRDAALGKAIEAVTKDGKFDVNREKASKLAAKLGNPETMEADLAEIVDALKVEKKGDEPNPKPGERKPPIAGQPSSEGAGKTTELDPKDWAKLKKTDPVAYEAMIKERRGKTKFLVPR